ncbi:MAG: amidohydrolase 2 [Amycolatopsis sp.]|uniref:amidohydrolase family protein n=1 Tax=Amycolatopsis sp. TaxID=37632 RepID=UPI0026174F26|nr:amidohydrolase family protein [Amycolatopsis sp.]MCU1683953.1 amidohydrolase 2 [Amycolatopsis sp.]
MLIIDSQIHLWDSGQPPPHHRQTPHLAEVALDDMNAAGVTAAINSPPPFDVNSRYAIESARRFPDRFATTGSLDLSRAEAPDLVRRWRSQPGMIGFRFLCGLEDERSWPTDGTMDWFLPLAQELGLPVALGGPFVLPHVERWAAQYPDLKLTIDHFGIVGLTPSRGLIQHDDLLSWSRFPNVSVKMSGAPDYAREDEYPFKSMHDTIRLLYDAYGPERLFWGTDITRLDNCTWRQAVTMFTEELPWLSDTDKTLIMGEALCRWFSWWPSLPPAARPEGAGR